MHWRKQRLESVIAAARGAEPNLTALIKGVLAHPQFAESPTCTRRVRQASWASPSTRCFSDQSVRLSSAPRATFEGQWRNQVIRYHVTSGWKLQFNRYIIKTGMRGEHHPQRLCRAGGPGPEAVGDDGRRQPHGDWAQDPDRRNGKVMRINRNGTRAVRQPDLAWPQQPDDRLLDRPSQPAGHHLPARDTAAPTRQSTAPTATTRSTGFAPGRNYGWPCVTGNNHVDTGCGQDIHTAGLVVRGTDAGDLRRAPSSTAPDWGSWNKSLFVSTLKESDLRRLTVNPGDWQLTMRMSTLYNIRWGRLRAAVMAPGGRLFLTTSNGNNDKVIRITPN